MRGPHAVLIKRMIINAQSKGLYFKESRIPPLKITAGTCITLLSESDNAGFVTYWEGDGMKVYPCQGEEFLAQKKRIDDFWGPEE